MLEMHIVCSCPRLKLLTSVHCNLWNLIFKINQNPIHQQCTKSYKVEYFFTMVLICCLTLTKLYLFLHMVLTYPFVAPCILRMQFLHQFLTMLKGDVCIGTGHIYSRLYFNICHVILVISPTGKTERQAGVS